FGACLTVWGIQVLEWIILRVNLEPYIYRVKNNIKSNGVDVLLKEERILENYKRTFSFLIK
ncbi:hypothetical protein, partial [Clostridium sp. ATCC 25772]|uniref:hypothetical protein n=1 Tax=Clostridium sp. ATCC 25772 TaxID=1676991 RepID=UPI000A4C1FEE